MCNIVHTTHAYRIRQHAIYHKVSSITDIIERLVFKDFMHPLIWHTSLNAIAYTKMLYDAISLSLSLSVCIYRYIDICKCI